MYKMLWPLLLTFLLLACQAGSPQPAARAAAPDMGPLLNAVAQCRDAQLAAVAQFEQVRSQLLQLPGVADGITPQALSATLLSAFDTAVQATVTMNTSTGSVQQAADTLFRQWEIENAVFTDAGLKAASEAQLARSWQDYQVLMQALQQSSAQADPVLNVLRDTLHASAVRAVQPDRLAADIAALQQQLRSSIGQANAFLANVQQ